LFTSRVYHVIDIAHMVRLSFMHNCFYEKIVNSYWATF